MSHPQPPDREYRGATDWLLSRGDPSVRYHALVDVLGRPPGAGDVGRAREQIKQGPRVRALFRGQQANGGFGVHPYQKWTGAHWRLVSLVELGIGPDEPRARAAADQVLCWLTGPAHRRRITRVAGLTRRCASQEGNALAVCCRLGLADDARVRYLAQSLLAWQWPDGGWNCDKREGAHHASFYESLAPLWGLIEYAHAAGEAEARDGAQRAADFFLRHHLFRSEADGTVINPEWLQLHYPLYWHYDVLQALLVLSRLGPLTDARAQEAVTLVEQKCRADGLWRAEGWYWWPPGRRRSNIEVVNWGRRGPNAMITLNALRVLKAAGRIPDKRRAR